MPGVLVVEDNEQNLGLIRYLLRSAGITCSEARDGREGVARAKSEQPDLILMDIQLPLLDGYGALAELRQDPRFAHTCIVAVTAYSMSGDRERALKAGFDGYLSKPIDPFTFATTIHSYLAQADVS